MKKQLNKKHPISFLNFTFNDTEYHKFEILYLHLFNFDTSILLILRYVIGDCN